tara:strand:+ start:2614 stop:3063 length:450 start_codon:yes stop_codon:yes gene_type:complete
MKRIFYLIKILIFYFCIISDGLASKANYFEEGKKFFEKNQIKKSKILFEKDIVFNPKSEKSYLYLAKIYNKDENLEQEEMNLNNVLILNPQNDEAIYMLTLIKIKLSDYDGAKKLIKQFNLVCDTFCSKKNEIAEKLRKITPENVKEKN